MSAKHNLFSMLVLLLTAAGTSQADAVKDFSTGTSVMLGGGTVIAGTSRTSTGSGVIAKARDTLDFAMRAEDLGVKLPITIQFRGRDLGGGWIEFAIDDTFRTPIDLGDGHYLSRIAGRVFMRAVPLRGKEPQTVGNTRLVLAGLSFVTTYGDWGELLIPITKLAFLGGVPQPALEKFAELGGRVCSGKEKTLLPLVISLAGEAKASGAHVELKAPRDAGVRLPPGIVLHPGTRTAIVDAVIEPDFVGTAHVTASAGGVVQSLDVVVHHNGDCERR